LESLSGTIQVKAQLNHISIKTDSGSIFLYVSEDISCNLDINTVSGKINTEFDSVVGNIGDKKIQGKIGIGETDIKVKTVSGNISLLKL